MHLLPAYVTHLSFSENAHGTRHVTHATEKYHASLTLHMSQQLVSGQKASLAHARKPAREARISRKRPTQPSAADRAA